MKFYLIVLFTACSLQKIQSQMLPHIWDYYDKYEIETSKTLIGNVFLNSPSLVCAFPTRILPFRVIGKDQRVIIDTSLTNAAISVFKDSILYKNIINRRRYNQFFSFDTAAIHLFAQGVTKKNVQLYRFRFVKNDSIVIRDWTLPTEFMGHSYTISYDSSMAFLGTIQSEFNSKIRIDIMNTDSNKTINSTEIYWLFRSPEIIASFGTEHLSDFLRVFRFRSSNISDWDLPDYVDSLTTLRKSFNAPNSDVILLSKDWVSEKIMEYKLDDGNWTKNLFHFQIVWLKNLSPGKHKVELRYDFNPTGIGQFEFEILPAWYQTLWFKLLMVLAAATVVGLFVLLYRNQKQKQFIKEQANSKKTKELELTTIRSQLNPHFVLNALNSIQSVFLTRPKEEANKYLTNFGNLMRDTLGKNSKEWTSLRQEITLLKDYLELEQLRFGFGFEIKIDQSIDPTTVEVPTLLLQPLVENAVKHGISGIREKGMVEIIVEKNKTDMVISIRDNGNGGIMVKPEGQGLQLTIDRLHLIKEINSTQIIEFDNSRPSTVILTFKNWLAE